MTIKLAAINVSPVFGIGFINWRVESGCALIQYQRPYFSWQELKDIIYRVRYGILRIGAIIENFYSNIQKTGSVLYNCFLRQESALI
jgi:hypothetical protein